MGQDGTAKVGEEAPWGNGDKRVTPRGDISLLHTNKPSTGNLKQILLGDGTGQGSLRTQNLRNVEFWGEQVTENREQSWQEAQRRGGRKIYPVA